MENFRSEYDFYKVKPWLNIERIYWWQLVKKRNAILFIEKNLDYLTHSDKEELSRNPFAATMLGRHTDKIIWNEFVHNPNAIHVIEQNLDLCIKSLTCYGRICLLQHPDFIHIIINNKDKIIDEFLNTSCLNILARHENMVYINLLDEFIMKYPDKLLATYYFWDDLLRNKNAIHVIEKCLHLAPRDAWQSLAYNSNAIHIIEQNLDKFNQRGWDNLSENPNAIHLLKKNLDKINWYKLSNNKNAFEIFKEYPEKIQSYSFIDYDNFSVNSSIFEYDYDAMEKRCSIYKEELMEIALHPSRIESYLQQGISAREIDNYI